MHHKFNVNAFDELALKMRNHLDAAFRKTIQSHIDTDPMHQAWLSGMASVIALVLGTNGTDEFNRASERARKDLAANPRG